MNGTLRRAVGRFVAGAFALQLALMPSPAAAAAGDLIADVVVPDRYPSNIAPSVAFDGQYLYYVGYGGPVLHRIDVPPPGGTNQATGHVETPISGAPGIMTLSYDAGRDAFWAVGGDGASIYLLTKSGAATLAFNIDPVQDRPKFQTNQYVTEVKIAYDRTDDTIWYSPDATTRIYHYHTTADALGTAQLVSASPYIDVGLPPNDMAAQCGYSQSSGIAVGGANLFVSVAGCNYLFEYTKTGTKVAWYAYNTNAGGSTQDVECDNLSYGVPVFWIRDAWDGHIRAFEQPGLNACRFGGGDPLPPPAPVGFPVVESLTASSFPVHTRNHPVAMPDVVNAGDLLIAIFTSHGNGTVATPQGWTSLDSTVSVRVRTGIYAKRADGSEGGTTVDFVTTVTELAVAHVYRVSGWRDSGVITADVTLAVATGEGLAPDAPALDPATWDVEKTLWLAAYGAENLGVTSGYPASYTHGRYDTSGGLVGRTSTASARRENAVASEDPTAFKNDASQPWIAATIAVRPRAAN
jgi:hypothetical protein